MSDVPPDDGVYPPRPPAPTPQPIHEAHPVVPAEQRKRHFVAIWLIPIIAAVITAYLGARSYSTHGPLIAISFKTAEGLTAGQTQVRYKAVPLGTVESIELKKDRSGVEAHVRMTAAAEPMLTSQAHFWVVRPRLSAANISSLSTLVSGTFIQLDPGRYVNEPRTHFIGFDNPPDITPDDEGTQYVLKTNALGSVNVGSGVYYRGMEVGEVISVRPGDGFGPINVVIFVRSPYDRFVRADSRFWSASGLSIKSAGNSFQVQMQSFQALMIGGVAFATPLEAEKEEQAPPRTEYVFYPTEQAAEVADHVKHMAFVTYLQSSVHDLAPGSPVQIYGITVGRVTGVKLVANPQKNDASVRIAFDVDAKKALGTGNSDDATDYAAMMQQMVQSGMRVKVESSNMVLGQQIVSLEFVPQGVKKKSGAAEPAPVAMEDDVIVLPGDSGGLDGITEALGDIAAKLNRIPFDKIGGDLQHLVATADKTLAGEDMQQAIHGLAVTMSNASELSQTAKQNMTPALQRLPEISAQLQEAVQHANEFLGSVDNSYGAHSDFNRDARRVMEQANEAARSIRLLADYLQRHPEALLKGKTLSTGVSAPSPAPAHPVAPASAPVQSPMPTSDAVPESSPEPETTPAFITGHGGSGGPP